MKPKKLDDIDIRIVRELQNSARVSNVALAKIVNLTEGAVRRRIDNLVSSGALRIVGVGDPEWLGLKVHAVIAIRVAAGQVDQLLEAFTAMREFSYVYQVTGKCDIMAVGFFPSNEHLREFLTTKIGRMEGVFETETFLIMKTAKRSFRWGEGSDSAPNTASSG